MIKNKKFEIALLCTWLVCFSTALFTTPQFIYIPDTINIPGLIGFFILLTAVSVLPIVVNDVPIFFVQGVSLAVFLVFGLLVEMIFMQISIILLFSKVRLPREKFFKVPLNLLMFLIISIIGALVFYALGGHHNYQQHVPSMSFLLPTIGYIFITFFMNQLLILLSQRFIYKQKDFKIITNDFIWDILTSFLIYPVGIILYMLYIELGISAFFFVGIPLISISLILQLFYSSKKMNENLQKISEFGHHLAQKLQITDVTHLFLNKLLTMLNPNYIFILEAVNDEELRLVEHFDGILAEEDLPPFITVKKDEGIMGYVWANSKPVVFKSKKEWKKYSCGFIPDSVESILCLPINRNKETIGVILIASNQKHAYMKSQIMLIDIMTSYFAVAIGNAKHYEETKNESERCPLTKLYNYRYFEKVLYREFEKLNHDPNYHHLSLMLLDLDHFKTINDTYGHLSGNEVLCEVSNRIVECIGDKGIVARYGGEEFVVLLPNVSRNACLFLAEEVRKKIGNKPFTIHHNLENNFRKVKIRITTSIGVASAPDDADDTFTLIRHADRAMYNGAKLAGRNKVAQYVK